MPERPPGRIASTLEALEQIPNFSVPDFFQGIEERLDAPMPSIAVLGLFNRGKSTLFNALLGAPVSPISWHPETSTFVCASTGPEGAIGERNGAIETLPCAPEAFAAAIQRQQAAGWDRVEIAGRFRLPAGYRLIDTPGLNEPGAEAFARWRHHAILGGIVVVSWPPGVAEQDLTLLHAAQEALGGNVGVVVTCITPGVDEQEMVRIADQVSSHSGVDAIVVPRVPPTAGWGQDDRWVSIELLVGRLHESAAAARSQLGARYDALVVKAIDTLDRTSWNPTDADALKVASRFTDAAPRLRAALQRAMDGIAERAEAARRAADQAKEDQVAQQTTARLEREAQQVIARAKAAETEARAWQPTRWRDVFRSADPLFAAAGALWRVVATLADQGAGPAIGELQTLLGNPQRCQRLGLDPVQLVMSLPAGQTRNEGYRAARMSQEERSRLHRRLSPGGLRDDVARDLAANLRPDETEIAAQLRAASNPDVRTRALEVLAEPLVEGFGRLYATLVEDESAWRQERDDLVRRAELWLRDLGTIRSLSSETSELRQHIAYARDHGNAWARSCAAIVRDAKASQVTKLQVWRGLWLLSFVGWMIALVMLGNGGSAAGPSVLVWLAAFVLWLVSRNELETWKSPDSWRPLARRELQLTGAPTAAGVVQGGTPTRWAPWVVVLAGTLALVGLAAFAAADNTSTEQALFTDSDERSANTAPAATTIPSSDDALPALRWQAGACLTASGSTATLVACDGTEGGRVTQVALTRGGCPMSTDNLILIRSLYYCIDWYGVPSVPPSTATTSSTTTSTSTTTSSTTTTTAPPAPTTSPGTAVLRWETGACVDRSGSQAILVACNGSEDGRIIGSVLTRNECPITTDGYVWISPNYYCIDWY